MKIKRWLVGAVLVLATVGLYETATIAAQPAVATRPAVTTHPAEAAAGDPFTAPPLPACNPLDWKEPTTLPALRERLGGESYRKQYADALAAAPALTPERARALPLFGLRVAQIEPDSQAAKAGLHKGDLLVKLDEHDLIDTQDLISYRSRADQALTVQSGAGPMRQVTIKRGKIGVGTVADWNADVAYLRSPGRAAAFDDDFRVASIAFARDDAALGETALWHAWKGGYRGTPLAALMAYNAYRECRYDDALAYAMIALKAMTPAERGRLGLLAYGAALSTFKLELARELLGEYPAADANPASAARLEQSIALFREFPAADLPNPVEQLRTMEVKNATAELALVPDAPEAGWGNAAKDLAAGKRSAFAVEDGHYQRFVVGPAAPDVDLSVTFHFAATDATQSHWAKDLSIGLRDSARGGMPLVTVLLRATGKIEILREGPPDVGVWRDPAVGVGRAGHLRIVIVGHRMEVIADGRRLLYGPVLGDAAARGIVASFTAVGIKGEIESLSWRLPKPAEAVPKAAE